MFSIPLSINDEDIDDNNNTDEDDNRNESVRALELAAATMVVPLA
jgi:hypothetical protein